MKATALDLPGLFLFEPKVFGDDRGFFMETWTARNFREATGCDVEFVQDNHSKSAHGVLRGLHYQLDPHAQGKLVRAASGEIFDVAVDVRRRSKTFGRWYGVLLSAENKKQLWVPPGFAHGFVVVSETAEVLYKATGYYAASHERGLRWNDPGIGIAWPQLRIGAPLLSAKDAIAPTLDAATDLFP
jgi:dTDP-4-dehydrorhamnose 3,5-epimerase